jgi:hypothetical protein
VAGHQKQVMASHRKGDRHAKDREKITIRQNRVILNKIKNFCDTNNLAIQDFFELAASHYLDVVAGHQKQVVAGHQNDMVAGHQSKKWPAHDDMMMFKTHDDIIMLYKRFTKRQWKPADDRSAAKYNDTDRRLIELGMIITYIQARAKKINSFAYFIPEIEIVISSNLDKSTLDFLVRTRRERLNKWLMEQKKPPIEF